MSVIKFPKPSNYRSVVIEWLATDLAEGKPVDPLHIYDLANEIYFEMDELRALIGAPPARRAGGRPPKSFTARLAMFAGAWLDANGCPDNAADLVRAMEAQCDRRGWVLGDTQLRELAAELIEEFRALRVDDE